METCHAALGGIFPGGRGRLEAPWLKLLQAGRLVGADGEKWNKIIDVTFGTQHAGRWESVMTQILGYTEMNREEVERILKSRGDCPY